MFVNLKNDFVKQIRHNQRNCLCLVNACLVLAKTCFITGATEVEVHEHITGKVVDPNSNLQLSDIVIGNLT